MSELVIHTKIARPDIHACGVLKKINKLGQSACILFDNQEFMEYFDNLLWTFEPHSFIPHGVAATKAASEGAFVLSNNLDQLPDAQNLILLSDHVHPRFHANLPRFQRILDIVPLKDPGLTYGRNRFKEYRSMGLEPIIK